MEKHIMKLRNRWTFTIPALALAFFAGACAPKPFLKVQYQLPSPSSTLEGKKVALAVSDSDDMQASASVTIHVGHPIYVPVILRM